MTKRKTKTKNTQGDTTEDSSSPGDKFRKHFPMLTRRKITYFIIPREITVDGIIYHTYGIGAIKEGATVSSIHDITSDLNSLKKLVSKCNKGKLSLIHLHDVVEDFLAEN